MQRLTFTVGLVLGLIVATAASLGTYALAQNARPSDMPRVGEPLEPEEERPPTATPSRADRSGVVDRAGSDDRESSWRPYPPRNEPRSEPRAVPAVELREVEVVNKEPLDVKVVTAPVRYEVIKLVHAKRNAPTHQLLFFGPNGDHKYAANAEQMARAIFNRRHRITQPDDLVNLLASNGWEPISHSVAIHRGGGLDVEREYWLLRRPIAE